MINIKSKKGYLVALESVAMTDIVMNLFIFFFISFSLIYTFNPSVISRISVNLPKASSAIALEGSEKTVLAVNAAGEYFLNDDSVDGPALKMALEERLKENPEMSLLLKVDGMAKFESAAKALDVINSLDITKVSVAVTKEER